MPVVPSLEVEKYLDFKAMTGYLRAVGKAAPHLVRVFSIGKSRDGRPLLVAEVTNRNLKAGREKPGLWIDGGHQGWNLLGTMACLELLRFLVAGHGRDEFLTDLVDHNVFYLAPRLAPDQMESCLATGAIIPQDFFGPEPPPQQFRVESPVGSWKPFKRDARVLVQRNPEDRAGPFYDLYRNLDSARLRAMAPSDFPTSEKAMGGLPLRTPSTKAVFEFLRSYQNIFGVISNSGPGDSLRVLADTEDIHVYRALGQRLGELSGLPFTATEPEDLGAGGFLTWSTQTLGVLSVDCRLWSLRKTAGLTEPAVDHLQATETELLQIIRYCEKEFPEGSFNEWKDTTEPGLGAGQRGGWDWSRTWLNPPAGPYLSRELKRFSRLALGLASAGPRLVIAEVQEKLVGWSAEEADNEPLRHLAVRIENRGYLPTRPVGQPEGKGAVVRSQLLKGSAERLIGEEVAKIPDLQGTGFPQVDDGLPPSFEPRIGMSRSAELDYLYKGSAEIEITVAHPMAGSDKVVSRPSQILQPPSFGQPSAPAAKTRETEPLEDSFDEVFPSFEDIYNEGEVAPLQTAEAPAPPVQPAAPAPPPPPPPSKPKPPPPPSRAAQPLRQRRPVAPPPTTEDEFSIPLPPLPGDRPNRVEFPSLGGDPAAAKGPFPASKPAKGRVFGSPPQKPTGGLPASLGGTGKPAASASKPAKPASGEGDFSPLPLVGSTESSFEPLVPGAGGGDLFDASDTIGGGGGSGFQSQSPAKPTPPEPTVEDLPAAPPARLSRTSTPQLLRRQRANQPNSGDPFGR